MTESRKVLIAVALSVLVHASLFAALALMPASGLVPAKPEPEEKPELQVTIEAAPVEIEEAVPAQADALRTQLEPENLKKADKAPEHPTEIAAHDSQATPPQVEKTTAQPTPMPLPDLAATFEPASTPTASLEPTADKTGIDALGNYGKAVGNAIGVRWDFFRKAQKNLPVGEVRMKFAIDAEGRVSDLTVVSNSASPANAAIAMRAVKEAKIPPIPAERLAQLPGGRIEITYSFIHYTTQ